MKAIAMYKDRREENILCFDPATYLLLTRRGYYKSPRYLNSNYFVSLFSRSVLVLFQQYKMAEAILHLFAEVVNKKK